MDQWLPKSIFCLRNYTFQDFAADLAAGVTVGLVALPLAMAFAIAAGLSPQAGVYCAVVTGFLISALVASADRRPHRRVCRGGRRDRRKTRCRWPVYVHHDGRRSFIQNGRDWLGCRGEVPSSSRGSWLHEWHCSADRRHSGQERLRSANRQGAVTSPAGCARFSRLPHPLLVFGKRQEKKKGGRPLFSENSKPISTFISG